MKVWVQEMQRWVVERAKGTDAITVTQLCQAMQVMPNGYGVLAIENRDDGTTIVHVRAPSRKQVPLPRDETP